jgi:AcrR family transcriptional regulator
MPKAPRTIDELNSVKEKILDEALQLIIEEGYSKLSMRKLASRMGVTATNIYNYYTNKDEINLMIRTRGFEMLHSVLQKVYDENHSHADRLKAMLLAYADFGVTYPDYYDIMFNLRTPKVTDYIGTKFEPNAISLKTIARNSFYLFADPIFAIMKAEKDREEEIHYITIQFWSDMHGIISLYNSRLLSQLKENSFEIMNKRINDLFIEFIASRISK